MAKGKSKGLVGQYGSKMVGVAKTPAKRGQFVSPAVTPKKK